VAIANALQLEAARATPALFSRFNYNVRRHAKFEVTQPLHCRIIAFLLLIHYFTLWPWSLTLWPWPLTFDLERLQRIAYDTMKLRTKFERNRAIHGEVVAILVFDLMTLNIVLRVALSFEIIFTKFDLRQLPCLNYSVFWCWLCYVTLWPWPLTRWPWKFVEHQASRGQSLYEIWAKSSKPRLNYW